MTESFRALIVPNYSAKTSLADFAVYFFGGFLLILPVLPLSQIRFYFAIFTFFLYSSIIVILAISDFVKAIDSASGVVWQIETRKIKVFAELEWVKI